MHWLIIAATLVGVYAYVRGAVRFVDRRKSELVTRTRQSFPDLYADYSDEYIRKHSLESSEVYLQAVVWPIFTLFHRGKAALQQQPTTRSWLHELTLERLEDRLKASWERRRNRYRRQGPPGSDAA